MKSRTEQKLKAHRGAFVKTVTKNLEWLHDDETGNDGIGRRYSRDYVAGHRCIRSHTYIP